MKRHALIPITGEEDPEITNRKSHLRRRRIGKGLSIGQANSQTETTSSFWWQAIGRYQHEVEATYDQDGHYLDQRYTGRTRCA